MASTAAPPDPAFRLRTLSPLTARLVLVSKLDARHSPHGVYLDPGFSVFIRGSHFPWVFSVRARAFASAALSLSIDCLAETQDQLRHATGAAPPNSALAAAGHALPKPPRRSQIGASGQPQRSGLDGADVPGPSQHRRSDKPHASLAAQSPTAGPSTPRIRRSTASAACADQSDPRHAPQAETKRSPAEIEQDQPGRDPEDAS